MNDDTPSRRRRGNAVANRWVSARAGGFTIVETLIVLGVSGFMLLSAILMITGQQRKVEFNQAAQEIKSSIEQTISEVSTGYFPNPNSIRCTVSGGNLSITNPGNRVQGSNTGCVFLGKAIQFGVAGTDPQQYIVHTVAGLQDNNGTLASARPTAVNFEVARDDKQMRNGLRAVSMKYVSGAIQTDIGAVAFLNGLGQLDSDSQLMSGSQQLSMVPIQGSGVVPNTTIPGVVSAIDSQLATSPVNPDGGVLICFVGGGDRSALITIGSNGRSLGVKLDYKNTGDCS